VSSAKELIADAVARHEVRLASSRSTADRGSSHDLEPRCRAAQLLGIGPVTFSPAREQRQSFSESQFKTNEVLPGVPRAAFGSVEDARTFCEAFFSYYNHEHRHSGIGYHTPASVHFGTAAEVRAQRAETPGRPPTQRTRSASGTAGQSRPKLPTVAWINEPLPEEEIRQKAS